MGKEIEEILDDIGQFLLTASDADLAYRALSPVERARSPQSLHDFFDSGFE